MSKTPTKQPDAAETGHEFSSRMAADGKALYVPGRTVAEVKAAQAAESARRAEPQVLTLELSEEQFDALDLAIPEACELIADAGRIFSFLVGGYVSGHIDPEDGGAYSIMRMAAKALSGAETREIAALDMIEQKLRHARRANREEA